VVETVFNDIRFPSAKQPSKDLEAYKVTSYPSGVSVIADKDSPDTVDYLLLSSDAIKSAAEKVRQSKRPESPPPPSSSRGSILSCYGLSYDQAVSCVTRVIGPPNNVFYQGSLEASVFDYFTIYTVRTTGLTYWHLKAGPINTGPMLPIESPYHGAPPSPIGTPEGPP